MEVYMRTGQHHCSHIHSLQIKFKPQFWLLLLLHTLKFNMSKQLPEMSHINLGSKLDLFIIQAQHFQVPTVTSCFPSFEMLLLQRHEYSTLI